MSSIPNISSLFFPVEMGFHIFKTLLSLNVAYLFEVLRGFKDSKIQLSLVLAPSVQNAAQIETK